MADAAPSAISRLETCNVNSSCDPGHPSAWAGHCRRVRRERDERRINVALVATR